MIEPILWGLALAATAGLRLFMPFLFVGALARYAGTPTPEMLAWTASDAGFLLLLIATLVEILGDKIPAVDHALDAGATFIKPAAGLILPVALLQDTSPMAAWTLGIIAGAPLALGVHTTKAGTRALSSATTLGTGNPIISTFEDALAVLILVLTAIAPIVAVLLVAILSYFVIRALRRMGRLLGRRKAEAPDGSYPPGAP
ncbi:MAG TPA: DUF4126 domain-containing protein [Longimicrobiales bacterium]|nr:DUF4126 domain-containing protein [Longimicrobiales bacterium]